MRASFQRPFVRATAFRAASNERWKDAKCLHNAGRFQGAIYLCGYALECELKHCICRARRVSRMEESEAKSLGHDLLRSLTAADLARQLKLRRELFAAFHRVNNRWSTEIRYSGAMSSERESESFLRDSRWLLRWLRTESGW